MRCYRRNTIEVPYMLYLARQHHTTIAKAVYCHQVDHLYHCHANMNCEWPRRRALTFYRTSDRPANYGSQSDAAASTLLEFLTIFEAAAMKELNAAQLRCFSKVQFQVWTNNMRELGEPVIVDDAKALDGTRVTFRPDLAKFGIAGLDDAICRMFRKRTYDVAGTLRNVNVYYNGELVEVPSFREYVKLYSTDAADDDILYVNASRRWQWAVKRSTNGFQQISFVNNIATTGGGKHVDHITDQIVNIVKPLVDAKLKHGIKKVLVILRKLWLSLDLRWLAEIATVSSRSWARRGSETISFYSMKEFSRWREITRDAEKYTIKYYKGLGTSTSKEAREYFSNFEKHLVQFRHEDDNDDLRIRLVFDKRRSDDRKQWITERLVAVDQVNQLAAAVALNEAYHHGEASLVTTIVRLAQNFVGMNNVCLLEPLGQFGTRHEGGDDAASARYIYTKLTPFTRLIFPPADDELLHYLEEENQLIEPEWCRHSRIFPELYKKLMKIDLKSVGNSHFRINAKTLPAFSFVKARTIMCHEQLSFHYFNG
ncbi:DNA topoisomerase II [Teladorsagia circumcincta]|uniref:DNA topoisomerase 2 n=1 Tax=Teladorsagia circumcincta TaxID=45464 RepID=A0A2G9UR86_TELCI|nr:DNA topoisomerase II [Teladorsagia circumcincta]